MFFLRSNLISIYTSDVFFLMLPNNPWWYSPSLCTQTASDFHHCKQNCNKYLRIFQAINMFEIFFATFSGAELPGHSIYIDLICIRHARMFRVTTPTILPQEAFCAPISLTTLGVIQLSNFYQFNIVNLNCILIIIFSMASGTRWF